MTSEGMQNKAEMDVPETTIEVYQNGIGKALEVKLGGRSKEGRAG